MARPDFMFIGSASEVREGRVLVKVRYLDDGIDRSLPILLQRPGMRNFDFTFLTLIDGAIELLDMEPDLIEVLKDSFKTSFVFGRPHFSIRFIH